MTPPLHNPLWQEHLEWVRRLHNQGPPSAMTIGTGRISVDDGEAEEARRGEWTATPPGRLGRPLLADIEPYLEFFAIAVAN